MVVVSPEAVEGAVEGAGEFRSRFVDNPDEEEFMMTVVRQKATGSCNIDRVRSFA